MRFLMLSLCLGAIAFAQQSSQPAVTTSASENVPVIASRPAHAVTLPAGLKVPIVIKHAISTKNARENDPIYAETNFPVVIDNHVVIPVGTYVQGVISRVQRPGRVKGRGELLVHFNTLIFPNGYTIVLPGALDNIPGAEQSHMKGNEGTVQGEGSKGKDVETVASTTGTGAMIGAIAGNGKGAGIGALGGGVAGLATVLFTRGPDLRIENGTTIEMQLERPITIDRDRAMAKN